MKTVYQIAIILVSCGSLVIAQEKPASPKLTPEQVEFFEKNVRPILVDRCYKCHSGKSKDVKAGFRLDSRAALLKGGDSGPAIVPGDPDKSLLVKAVRYEANEMPPNQKLKNAQIEAIERWVKIGAPWPNDGKNVKLSSEQGYDWEKAKEHWSFQPIRKPTPPKSEDGVRAKSAIDQFIAAGIKEKGLKQPAPATARFFARRVFLDLLGMPPTVNELNHWVSRLEQDATEGLNDAAVSEFINNLLERPEYGERWGRHWLDVARYSDVGGWTQDNRAMPQAWRYRDWVVKAFNDDLPFNEFVRQQISGDIGYDAPDPQAAVGTGLFALGPSYSSDGGDPESVAQAKSETLDDRVDTFARAFLGLTVACARCHDHKFDPIPTQDYYSLAGIFNNSRPGETPLVDRSVVDAYNKARRQISDVHNAIRKTQQQASKEKRPLNPEEQEQIKKWQEEVKQLEAMAPPKYDFAHTIYDSGASDMRVALRGNLLKQGRIAPRRFLRVVAGEDREHFQQGSGRSQLAKAVIDPANPLTARVIVNRIWLNHFGQALVRTPNNFGLLGETPTHPGLLDWLASTFIEADWSIKSMHRLIMNSATYRFSSSFDQRGFDVDGDNRTVWRMNPRRMDVETWRDSLLAVTGELDRQLGGPAIGNIVNSKRRTLYAKISRNAPFESDVFLRLFDFPIPRGSNAQRTTNVIPQQFLFMMNSQFMVDRAQALVKRLQSHSQDLKSRIDHAYRLLYSRPPTNEELQAAKSYLSAENSTSNENDRWRQYCQVLLIANEFMYVR